MQRRAANSSLAMPARDWRLAALGGGCSALGSACLFLAACSVAPPKPQAVAPAEIPATAGVAPSTPAVTAASAPVVKSDWEKLRDSFTLNDCDYSPEVQQLSRWFTSDPPGFAESLQQSLPFLLFVAQRIEQRGMPGEFALLPYIESNYVPLSSSGDRAAGIWQLLPDTAREAGLRITSGYDGRLDIAASTDAALGMLENYNERFDDWRVADMAFNAGPYRIITLLHGKPVPADAAELRRLRVDDHTHRHLAKLLAVACVIENPARFGVKLPEPQASDRLTEVGLPTAVDLLLAARLSNIDPARLRQLNPGYVSGRMPAGGPYRLLLPEANGASLKAALARLPQPLWGDWHEIVLQQSEMPDVLAQAHGIDTAAFAVANAILPDVALPSGARVLVPGRDKNPLDRSRDVATSSPPADKTPGVHVVRAGDTLSGIARAAHIGVDDLLRWNGIARTSTLRLGQRLRVRAPENGGAARTAVASP